MKKLKIMILANDTTYTYNLRREIIERLIADGHRVIAACKVLKFQDELEAIGCKIIDVHTGRQGTNPVEDMTLFIRYIKLLRHEKPDVVLSYNIKPNVYGGLACRLLGIRYLPNITGLGTAVEYPGKMQKLTTLLYKWGTYGADCMFFQNTENLEFFRSHKMLSPNTRTHVLPGSGVALDQHPLMPYPETNTIEFLFVARILKEKGIDLYLAAAKSIHEKWQNTIFHICGGCDDEKYIEILKQAENDGYVQYHGEQKDMKPWFERCHCLVHPSYYPEGMSNVLLEAAASGRPVIATDRSGCRETVDDGLSGFVIPNKDENTLIAIIEKFLVMSTEERKAMGLVGRAKVEREFDRMLVVKAYMEKI